MSGFRENAKKKFFDPLILLIPTSCKFSEKTNKLSLRYLKTDTQTDTQTDAQG